jgi:S1-C subfamily serine protease
MLLHHTNSVFIRLYPALDSDLVEGDIATKIDGKKVKDREYFSLIDVDKFKEGKKEIEVEFLRDGKKKITTLKFDKKE